MLPRKIDPPMAKQDEQGNLITAPAALRNLYTRTYVERLRHRPIKEDFQDIFELKTTLWAERYKSIQNKKSKPWTISDIEKITKKLKNNQTRDPIGMVNELLKPGVMGQDLKKAISSLMNGVKVNFFFPAFMQLSNISSLYKNRGSRFSLDNDRGIFILTVFRKVLDKLIYQDKHSEIEKNMSDSNIGGRKGKNVKDHLFIIYGIINSVLVEEKTCIDIQIYDLVQAFDRLWLEDCMNDLYDSLPSEHQDDKLALIYEGNSLNKVAVNTPVGLTDRVNIEHIVTQGGVFGPLQCSNSIDTIGKKCYSKGEHLYTYKKMVRIMPLSMVDDLLAVAPCSHKSVALNTYMNVQIELKKLRFHTQDAKGKSKCHVLHIGKNSNFCPTLQVHGTQMNKVTEDTYLGDIISNDGRNTKNINNRIGKGLGKISDIMNMLEKISLGQKYFKIALVLRESLFLNSILTNSDVWYGLTKTDIKLLEDLDLSLLRNFLRAPCTVPAEAVYLELGCQNIETIIKGRRLNYLHYLLKQNRSTMLFKVFITQWKYPASKNEWTEQIKLDLKDFGFPEDLEELEAISSNSFKNQVKKKSKEFAFYKFLEGTEGKSKLDNLCYRELRMAKYLDKEDISSSEAQLIFSYRTRMSNFAENYKGQGGPTICPLCESHVDSQKWSFHCKTIKENVTIIGNYSDIFSENVKMETAQTITRITKFREEYLNQRKVT